LNIKQLPGDDHLAIANFPKRPFMQDKIKGMTLGGIKE
jgi:hypothetical protein